MVSLKLATVSVKYLNKALMDLKSIYSYLNPLVHSSRHIIITEFFQLQTRAVATIGCNELQQLVALLFMRLLTRVIVEEVAGDCVCTHELRHSRQWEPQIAAVGV